jgi:hypothetical protein
MMTALSRTSAAAKSAAGSQTDPCRFHFHSIRGRRGRTEPRPQRREFHQCPGGGSGEIPMAGNSLAMAAQTPAVEYRSAPACGTSLPSARRSWLRISCRLCGPIPFPVIAAPERNADNFPDLCLHPGSAYIRINTGEVGLRNGHAGFVLNLPCGVRQRLAALGKGGEGEKQKVW